MPQLIECLMPSSDGAVFSHEWKDVLRRAEVPPPVEYAPTGNAYALKPIFLDLPN